jgi:hypothetical protein
MAKQTTVAGLAGLVAAALLVAACSESLGPERGSSRGPAFDVAGDQLNGTLNESGTMLIKGFNPTNPHLGDAIVATFVWLGSTNIIDSVTDVLTTVPYTPVGNKYTLVEYVTAGGVSMATYVATNVQNFPDPAPTSSFILAVRANLSTSVTDGGVMISAWSGVYPTLAGALAAHQSASGTGSSNPTTADPGAVPVTAGALAFGLTMSNALVPRSSPPAFGTFSVLSDANIVIEADTAVSASAGTVDPQWNWAFSSPSTWLASVFSLNEAPTKLVFTAQPATSLPCPAIMPPVQVTAEDDKGRTVTAYNGPVTIAIGHNAGALMPGTLSGTLTVSAVNGVARFGDLCIDQPNLPVNAYTLRATSGVVVLSVESAPFNIGAF